MKIKKYLKTALLAIACLSFASLFIAPASPTYAAYDICHDPNVLPAAKTAAQCGNSSDSLSTIVVEILKVVIGAAGVVAVIFIIIGGINYMTSAGDASKVEKGKKTILYATIGLVICALAFAIVNWVIGTALKQGDQEGTENTGAIVNQLPIA